MKNMASSEHSKIENVFNTCDADIEATVKDFRAFTEKYAQMRVKRRELQDVIKLMKENEKESRQSEMNQRQSLDASHKLLSEQQTIISKLVSVKDQLKDSSEEINSKNIRIQQLEQEKSQLNDMFQMKRQQMFEEYQQSFKELKSEKELEISKIKTEMETSKRSSEGHIAELNNKITTNQRISDERISAMTLDYEEQLQMAHAQLMQMRDENLSLKDKNNKVVMYYKKKIDDMVKKSEINEAKESSKENKQIKTDNPPLLEKPSKKMRMSKESNNKKLNNTRILKQCNEHQFDPLPVQISECSKANDEFETDLPKATVKPVRRKLFNKNVEFIEN